MKLTQISALVATAVLSLTANAEPFYMIVPDGVADNQTATTYQFGINLNATSTYTDVDGSYDGTDAYTFASAGDTVLDNGFGNVDSLLKADGTSFGGVNNLEGLSTNWRLHFDYTINGVIPSASAIDNTNISSGSQGIGVYYYSGLINVSYETLDLNGDMLTTAPVMNLNVLGSEGTIGNVILHTSVDFLGADSIAEDMFYFADGTNWFDLWTAGIPIPGIEIAARIDTNIDPQLIPTVNPDGTASRDNELNGSVEFNRVPEPATLALLGMGLVGLGLSRRHLKQA